MEDKECKSKCVGAGSILSRQHISFKTSHVTPILYEDNVSRWLRPEDMKIPHSELSMHIGAADKDVIAFFLTSGGSAHVVYDDGRGCCQFTSGLDSELLSPALRNTVKEAWPISPKSEILGKI